MSSHQTIGDRGSNRLKIACFFLLIFSVLCSGNLSISCKAQISNTLAFKQAVLKKIGSHGKPVDSIAGFGADSMWTQVPRTPGVKRHLFIEDPTVVFRKVSDSSFARSIKSVINFVDSTEIGFEVSFMDTIPRSDLKRVRHGAPMALRGSDPRILAKYLLPAALIGTGIAGIISLFYLRS